MSFSIGAHLTAIAGQNGTQKTTLLGLISQPFSITDKKNPLYSEKPLCGGQFKSAFAEKFKLSNTFDQPKSHEWTLHFDKESFTVESIPRKQKGKEDTVRFWKKGDRSQGSGYIQLPVIYLSLSRLLPLGEDSQVNLKNIYLTDNEIQFCNDWHKKILIILDKFKSPNYVESKNKNTLGVNTDRYDWKQNSAGQDNIGKILLAILSFKRLKEEYSGDYRGGILAIDEIDATLYPASQEKLVDALERFASDYNLQIIFTTHSLSVLKKLDDKIQSNRPNNQNKIVFLKRIDSNIRIIEDCSFQDIEAMLNVVSLGEIDKGKKKLTIFSEDEEARYFIKVLLGTKITKNLRFINCSLGNGNLIQLAKQRVPGFCSPDSIVILDGDVKSKEIKNLANFIILPSGDSPERLLAKYLYNLNDSDNLWEIIARNYTKQVCFKNYPLDEIVKDRDKAKKWLKEQKVHWGRGASKVINPWKIEHEKDVTKFVEEFKEKYNEIADKIALQRV